MSPGAEATPVRFAVTMTSEEGRLLREPGDKAVLDALVARVVDAAYRTGLAHGLSAQARDQAGRDLEVVASTARQVVEGLAQHGNPAATIALLEAERRTQADRHQAEAVRLRGELVVAQAEVGRLRADLGRALEDGSDKPRRVEIVSMPTPAPKDIRVSFDHDQKGSVSAATGTVIPAGASS